MKEAKVISMFLITLGTVIFLQSALSFWQGYRAVEKEKVLEERNIPVVADEISPPDHSYDIGEKIGYLHIERAKERIPVYHGSSEQELKKGIAHIEKSAWPDEGGNIVLSGHRDTVFRNIGNWQDGDKLVLEIAESQYEYKIKKIRIVDKEDDTVLVPRPREQLTITTCYPFQFIGSAPERYVVVAERLKK